MFMYIQVVELNKKYLKHKIFWYAYVNEIFIKIMSSEIAKSLSISWKFMLDLFFVMSYEFH